MEYPGILGRYADDAVEPWAPDTRPVRMTPLLMELIVQAAAGRGHRIDWGAPDADGFYTPTVTLNVEQSEPVR